MPCSHRAATTAADDLLQLICCLWCAASDYTHKVETGVGHTSHHHGESSRRDETQVGQVANGQHVLT